METVFTNARIVLVDEVIHGSLAVKDGRIAALDRGVATLGENLEGDYLVPGLVELQLNGVTRILWEGPAPATVCEKCKRERRHPEWLFCPHDGQRYPKQSEK